MADDRGVFIYLLESKQSLTIKVISEIAFLSAGSVNQSNLCLRNRLLEQVLDIKHEAEIPIRFHCLCIKNIADI